MTTSLKAGPWLPYALLDVGHLEDAGDVERGSRLSWDEEGP